MSRNVAYMTKKNHLALLAVLFILPAALLAQSGAGSIQGTVQDSTGAALPGCTIQVLNQSTGVTLKSTSNNVGAYAVLGVFGCERMDDVLAADEDKARALVERAERGEPIAPPPAPKDEFADFP